jgi:hypothetical protein
MRVFAMQAFAMLPLPQSATSLMCHWTGRLKADEPSQRALPSEMQALEGFKMPGSRRRPIA